MRMRLNLLLDNPGDVRSGYVNIDPFAPADDPAGRVACAPHELSSVVDANEVSELVAHDVLDAYQSGEVDQVLEHWLSRLAHGGTLALSVVDLREVCRAYLAGKLDADAVNSLLHGEQNGPGRLRQCSLTLGQLVEVLSNKGLKVLSKRLANYRAVVVCQRP